MNISLKDFCLETCRLREMLNYTEKLPKYCRGLWHGKENTGDVGENNLTEAKRIIKLRKLCQCWKILSL